MPEFLIGAATTTPSGPGIVTQTRAGSPIENLQHTEISGAERFGLDATLKKHPLVKRRVLASPVYNCHGMTFASRRTGIHETAELRKILAEDKYERVNDVLPGDVILYIAKDGDIEHSGVVVETSKDSPLFHKVCSKWGKGPEVIHTVADCPYSDTRHEFYRVSA